MKEAFDQALTHRPETPGDYVRCAYRSLAGSYARALEELDHNTGCTCSKLVIVGGGAKNAFLNRLTEERTGKTVLALPIEATALGNLRVQMQADEKGNGQN
ncbi:MAG: rhamnulokinase, partial [Clostridia bacterium]|nr:rhamnulokinase [Clostridia bacterium]